MRNREASSELDSPLVRLFVQRSAIGSEGDSPRAVIRGLVGVNRPKRAGSRAREIQLYLRTRNILSLEIKADLNCDGMLEPIGGQYEDGFRMYLKKGMSTGRIRFTMAHEVCHTFFYELVPEMKFQQHAIDQAEERLCNEGAAAMLIDERSLRRKTKDLTVSLNSLESLAHFYEVSTPTMLLRLRALRIWNCQLSHWHRTVGGVFVLESLRGGRKLDWTWDDECILQRVWETKRPEFGRGSITHCDQDGVKWWKRVSYHLQPSASGVTALWGSGVRQPQISLPLFNSTDPSPGRGPRRKTE